MIGPSAAEQRIFPGDRWLGAIILCETEQYFAAQACLLRNAPLNRLWLADWIGEEVLVRLEAHNEATSIPHWAAAKAAAAEA